MTKHEAYAKHGIQYKAGKILYHDQWISELLKESLKGAKTMKKSVSVSNLTLSLWLHFVRPVLRDLGMMEEVPEKDDRHEYTAEVIDEAVADDLEHCMTVACFNAHGKGKYSTVEEAAQMVYQLEVSVKYRKNVADAAKVIREQLAYKVSEAITKADEA